MSKTAKAIGSGSYSVKLFTAAHKTGKRVMSSRHKAVEPRRMHRDDLTDWVKEGHFNAEKSVVTDPRSINPYGNGSYGAGVAAMQTLLPASICKDMTGTVSQSGNSIKEWSGKIDPEIDAIVVSAWKNEDELFDIACKLPDFKGLRAKLRDRKSPRPGVKKANRETDPCRKFGNNIKTTQRISKGDEGGVTPYGWPLQQCQMCIDSRWTRVGSYDIEQFRIVVGRTTPQKEDYRDYRKSAVIAVIKKVSKPKVSKPVATPEPAPELVTA